MWRYGLEGLKQPSNDKAEKAPLPYYKTLVSDQPHLWHHLCRPARPPGGVLHPPNSHQHLGGGEGPGGDGGLQHCTLESAKTFFFHFE